MAQQGIDVWVFVEPRLDGSVEIRIEFNRENLREEFGESDRRVALVRSCFYGTGKSISLVIRNYAIDEKLIDVEHEFVIVGGWRFGFVEVDGHWRGDGHGKAP